MPKPLALRDLRKELAFVEESLAAHPDQYDTVRLMWSNRRDALEQEIAQTDREEARQAEVALMFEGAPVIGSREIRLDFAAKALDNYQLLVASVASENAGSEPGTRGPLPRSLTSKLFVTDMLRGSVGFLIQEASSEQTEMLPSAIKSAVDKTTTLLEDLSAPSDDKFEAAIHALSPRTISAVKKFAKLLHDAGAETRIVDTTHELALDHERTAILNAHFSQLDYAEATETRAGLLLGVFPEKGQYEFRAEDGSLLYGPVSDGFDQLYIADPGLRSFLMKPVTATFLVTTVYRAGIMQKQERTLTDVNAQVPHPAQSLSGPTGPRRP